jgi:hypothetical protein
MSAPTEQSLAPIDLVDVYTQSGLSWGSADLFLLGERSPESLGQHAAILAFLAADGQPAFSEVVIITPLPSEAPVIDAVKTGFEMFISEQRGSPTSPEELERAFRHVRFASPPTLESVSVTELVSTAKRHSGIIITKAALYREPGIEDAAIEHSAVEMGGPAWPPHLHRVAASVIAGAELSESYVALDAGESLPHEQATRELLLSVDRCGVITDLDAEPPVVSTSRYQQWLELARSGNIGIALEQLAAIDRLSSAQGTRIRIRLLRAAGLVGHLRAALASLSGALRGLPAETAVSMADAAAFASANDVAESLLVEAIPQLMRLEALELSLVVASRLGNEDLIEQAVERLSRLFPAAEALRRYHAQQRVDAGDFRGAAALIREQNDKVTQELTEFWDLAAEYVVGGVLRDPQAFVEAVATDLPNWCVEAVQLCVTELRREGRFLEALALTVATEHPARTLEPALALTALDLIEEAHIHADRSMTREMIATTIRRIVQCLSLQPDNATIRVRLLRTLSPHSLGATGVLALATVLMEFASQETEIEGGEPFSFRAEACKDEDLLRLAKRGAEWLSQQSPYVPGTVTFPQQLLDVTPDAALAGLEKLVIFIAEHVGEQGRDALTIPLALTVSIAPHSSAPNEDLVIIRAAASQAARAGRVQLARDLAEQGMVVASSGRELARSTRARLAWLGYADIFAHLGNVDEALVAMACALAIRAPRSWDDVWFESTTVIRILRDLGLAELARPLIAIVRRALKELGLAATYGMRADFLELQLDIFAFIRLEQRDNRTLEDLLDRATDQLAKARDGHDDIAPPASLLASLVAMAKEYEVHCRPEAVDLLRVATEQLPSAVAALLTMVEKGAPTPEELEAYVSHIEGARYAEDLGYDLATVAGLARRLLGDDASRAADVAVYAMELLTDQSVALPPPPGETENQRLITSRAATLSALTELAQGDLSVVLLGTMGRGDNASLVRLDAVHGRVNAPVIEPHHVFSSDAVRQWRESYPYAYGYSQDLNVFYTSTRGIGVSALPPRAILVASTDLQGFPPNLLSVADTLAGWDHRLSAAPSLTWLLASRRNPFSGEGRTVAWIPSDEPAEGLPALAPVAEELAATFVQYATRLDTGPEVPADFAGADLAIVAAHGGVGEGSRFFRVVLDDAGGAIGAPSFASRLGGAGTVVLFVCSSGRVDPHPRASAVVGLVKQLLDAGCRTVVAPPWPLAVSVPRNWLPAFMASWASGAPAIDACYDANMAVRDRVGNNPAECLAMTVYGDPLTVRTANR